MYLHAMESDFESENYLNAPGLAESAVQETKSSC